MGQGRFNPTASDVSYVIECGDTGPTEFHRAVYKDIEKRYPGLLSLITPLLDREYRAQLEGFAEPSSQPGFSLEIVNLPAIESESMKWSLEFSCGDQWPDALFEVHMNGWQPTGIISVMD
jgi:hypothetical protein